VWVGVWLAVGSEEVIDVGIAARTAVGVAEATSASDGVAVGEGLDVTVT